MLPSLSKDIFLSLVRLGIGNRLFVNLGAFADSNNINWSAIKALADDHGLSAVLLDGVECLPDGKRPQKEILLQWIGSTLQSYEYRFELYRRTIAEMASWYNSHGFKMMILKGYACALNWPKPEHRPCGDIDIWLFGKQKEADDLLENEKAVKIDTSEHHHTVYYWRDFMVENHYDFLNVYQHKSSAEIETILKELGKDDSNYIGVYGEKVYFPTPNLHALFLLKHSMCHFAAESITLRQLLDWAFFAQKYSKEIDWEWLESTLDIYGMRPLYEIYNAICIEDLGFDASIFHGVQFSPELKERVLNEILSPKYPTNNLPKNFFKRVFFKYRRWHDSEWKHELCYKDSMWSSFWNGVWMHLLKPGQI